MSTSIEAIERVPTMLNRLLEYDEVYRHRLFACPDYDTCLDEACAAYARSWSCRACAIYQEVFNQENGRVSNAEENETRIEVED